MPTCPNCNTTLTRQMTPQGIIYTCDSCRGKLIGLGVLRHHEVDQELVTKIWEKVSQSEVFGNKQCPHCHKTMIQISKGISSGMLTLDICKHCQCIWFDPREFEALPYKELTDNDIKNDVKNTELSLKAREALAKFQLRESKKLEMDFEETSKFANIFELIGLLAEFF